MKLTEYVSFNEYRNTSILCYGLCVFYITKRDLIYNCPFPCFEQYKSFLKIHTT